MNKYIIGLIVLLILLVIASFFIGDKLEDKITSIEIPLEELNASGQIGTVTLEADGDKTKVTIDVTEMETTGTSTAALSQPAHIHTGTCSAIGAVKYPLTSVMGGASETTLDVPLETLISELPLAVNIHKSESEIDVYTACGTITTEGEEVTDTATSTPTTGTSTSTNTQ